MYRSVTLKVLDEGLLEHLHEHPEAIEFLLDSIRIGFDGDRVMLDGRDVTLAIRENRVSLNVSFISSLKPVRDAMVGIQREMGKNRGVVMDGRDIATVVFPDAELKIFLVAAASERAKRRYAELIEKKGGTGGIPSVEELEEEILQRDRKDAERTHAPLKKHEDAIEVDTSGLTIEEQVALVYDIALKKTAG